jgi:hypothetical protein
MLDRPAQALKDWRLHAEALDDHREARISLAETQCRWDATTKVGLAGADRFDKQAEVYRTPPPMQGVTGWLLGTPTGTEERECWSAVALEQDVLLVHQTEPIVATAKGRYQGRRSRRSV